MPGIGRKAIVYKTIPQPEGASGEQQSTVYLGGSAAYPAMEMPATHYVTATSPLKSMDVVPSVQAAGTNATIVKRRNKMKGYTPTEGLQQYDTPTPQMYNSPYSSKFQPSLIGPHINFVLNAFLYRAGGVPFGIGRPGRDAPYLSFRVDQVPTRISGGSSPATMRPYPRFSKTQNIPRYSTMPQQYPTEGRRS